MEMAEAISARPKKMKNVLHSIMLKKAENGGVVAEHRMSQFDGKEPMHAFGANEGHLLAAHIQEHMGIAMPGKAEEPEEEA
jgi:hypothetical protein